MLPKPNPYFQTNINSSLIPQQSPQQYLSSQRSQSQSRIIPSYIKSQCQCELCAYDYDLLERVPMMLCNNQHHCCLVCVNEIIVRKKQCPFCRKDIQISKIFKNRMICKILEEMMKKQGKKIKINQNPQKMIKNNHAIIINDNNNIINNYIPPSAQHQQQAILAENQFNQNLLNLINNYQAPAPPPSICQRLQCSQGIFCFAYVLIFIINTPFFITEMIYYQSIPYQACLDTDYGVGMSLRTWLLSSALIGICMFGMQFLVVLNKICCFYKKKFAEVVSAFNVVLFLLKFLIYNILGLVVSNSIDSNDSDVCDDSLKSYMTAILVIMIVLFSCICGICDRSR